MVRDHRVLERGIEDVEDLVVAGACLVVAKTDLRHFIGDAGRRSDLEPAAGQVVQHADLLDQLPRRVIGRDHAERSESQRFGPCRDAGNQEVRRRRIGRAEMVLAEKDAFEAGRLGARPQVDITIEPALRRGRIEPLMKLGWRAEEFEDPGFYHCRPSSSFRQRRPQLPTTDSTRANKKWRYFAARCRSGISLWMQVSALRMPKWPAWRPAPPSFDWRTRAPAG